MRKQPSRGWYAVALIFVVIPVALAGVSLGRQVRSTIDSITILQANVTSVVQLHAGETRTLFHEAGNRSTVTPPPCKVEQLDGQPPLRVDPVSARVTVTLSDQTWLAGERIQAVDSGRVSFTCPDNDWVLGPDVGANGFGIMATFASGAARFGALTLLGAMVCGVMVLVVALRRRPAMS